MSKENRKKLKKRTIALITAAAFIGVLLLTFLGFYIAFVVSDARSHTWTPDCEKMSDAKLKEIYDREELGPDDYKLLFEQTGLTKVGIDRARERANGWSRVKTIHDEYFTERTVDKQFYAPLVCNDRTDRNAREIYLEKGDIVVSSSTHFAGFRIGHAAIVTNTAGRIFEATQVGQKSDFNSFDTITDRINFMVLRVKPEHFGGGDGSYKENLSRVTEYITGELKDAKYSVFTGVFTNKDKINYTMCSHIIWYGFRHFDDGNGGKLALDLDPNGGALVMPKDLSLSPYLELVQTFGFDPDKMYE